jgi:hypothetical protein
MRSPIALAIFVVSLFAATSAMAEKRIFIIANNSDGYGVDRCLAAGDNCGRAAAAAYCRTQQFAQAASFRKVDRDDITGAVSSGPACTGMACDEFVAIECSR